MPIRRRLGCSGATSCCAEHLCSPRRLHRRNAWLYSTKTHQSSMLLLSNSALLTEVLCTALRQASPSSGLAKVRKPMCCGGGCAQAADQPAGWARGWMSLGQVRRPTARADAQANAHTCLGTTLMSTSGPKLQQRNECEAMASSQELCRRWATRPRSSGRQRSRDAKYTTSALAGFLLTAKSTISGRRRSSPGAAPVGCQGGWHSLLSGCVGSERRMTRDHQVHRAASQCGVRGRGHEPHGSHMHNRQAWLPRQLPLSGQLPYLFSLVHLNEDAAAAVGLPHRHAGLGCGPGAGRAGMNCFNLKGKKRASQAYVFGSTAQRSSSSSSSSRN